MGLLPAAHLRIAWPSESSDGRSTGVASTISRCKAVLAKDLRGNWSFLSDAIFSTGRFVTVSWCRAVL